MASAASQRVRALALYRQLLRTSSKTFEGDQRLILAFREKARSQFQVNANETDAQKIEESLAMGEDVVKVLRQNVVQGKWKEDAQAYQLRMTKDTELGNNDSIKKAREQQIADIKAGKAPSRRSCREMAAEVNSKTIFGSTPSSSSSTSRTFSTLHASKGGASSIFQTAAFSSSARASVRDPSSIEAKPLPRPVPKFSSVTILADGSSVEMTTTSPRKLTRLTRDPTNHPLWNPSQERKVGGDGTDDSGRLGRFRRRFAEAEAEAQSASAPGSGTKDKSAPAKKSALAFGQEDFDWMSVGGREARAGSPILSKKGGKKGKK